MWANPMSGRYIRQVDVASVDTKFIERRKASSTELLDIVLSFDAVSERIPAQASLKPAMASRQSPQ